MLSQTRNAVDTLVACGLKREDFRCQTQATRKTRKNVLIVEYGNPVITLWKPFDYYKPFIAEIAKHFSVTRVSISGVYKFYMVIVPCTDRSTIDPHLYEVGIHDWKV